MERVLVIACGNRLRGDDGVAWHAAEELLRALPCEAKILCVHQLTPEMAEDVSQADTVVFLDAAQGDAPGAMGCDHVEPARGLLRFSHYHTPPELLALCKEVYGAVRPGFLITISGENFSYGDALSDAAKRALPLVVDAVSKIITESSERMDARQTIRRVMTGVGR